MKNVKKAATGRQKNPAKHIKERSKDNGNIDEAIVGMGSKKPAEFPAGPDDGKTHSKTDKGKTRK